MLSDVSLTNAGKFPGKYKKAKQRIKVNAHAEEIFYFSKRGHLCRCRYLTVPLLSQPRPQGTFHWLWRWGAVTAFWASPRFGHPHSHIPSVLGIPFSYYCSVLGIPRYPLGMPKSLVFWSSPPKQFWISRENRKPLRDGFR